MQVFISWSGGTSRDIALLLRGWLPEVVHELEPWMSHEDIDKGERWSPAIATRLEETSQGLVCVTAANLTEPWLNFEAGALAKSIVSARVRPLLFGVEIADLTGPLTQFQAASIADPEDMLKVVESLNAACANALPSERLDRSFHRLWAEFEEGLQSIAAKADAPALPKRTVDEKLDEMLVLLREGAQRSNGDPWATAGPSVPPAPRTPAEAVELYNSIDLEDLVTVVGYGSTPMAVKGKQFGVVKDRGIEPQIKVTLPDGKSVWLTLLYAREVKVTKPSSSSASWSDEPPF